VRDCVITAIVCLSFIKVLTRKMHLFKAGYVKSLYRVKGIFLFMTTIWTSPSVYRTAAVSTEVVNFSEAVQWGLRNERIGGRAVCHWHTYFPEIDFYFRCYWFCLWSRGTLNPHHLIVVIFSLSEKDVQRCHILYEFTFRLRWNQFLGFAYEYKLFYDKESWLKIILCI